MTLADVPAVFLGDRIAKKVSMKLVQGEGEDFNGTLLRMASVTAWGLVVAGVGLAVWAARRRWRVAHRAKLN